METPYVSETMKVMFGYIDKLLYGFTFCRCFDVYPPQANI